MENLAHRKVLRGIFLVLIFVLPAQRAFSECYKFLDPFYTRPFAKEVSLAAKELAGANRIFWVGGSYGLHPKQYVFDWNDEYAYLYHFAEHVVAFYTGSPVQRLGVERVGVPNNWERGAWPIGAASSIANGDVVLVSLSLPNSKTNTVEHPLPPFLVQRAKILELGSLKCEGACTFSPISAGEYELYVEGENGGVTSLGLVTVEEGRFRVPGTRVSTRRAFLLSFDVVKVFS